MVRSIFIYGAVSGFVVIAGMILGIVLSGGHGSQVAGYLMMVIALSVIFIAVKRYRDIEKGGVIKFLPAFGMGLAIAAVAGVAYVVTWEIYLALTDHAFMAQYVEASIEARRADGLSGAELQAHIADMNAMAESYANPFFRVPITFLEIFPVGLIIALMTAALLRNPRVLPRKPGV